MRPALPRRRWATVARHAGRLLLAATVLAGGCRKEEKAAGAAPPAPKPLTRVTVNFIPSISSAPLTIAKEEGFFEEEGIDLRAEPLDINAAMMALVSRDLDVFAGPPRPGIFNLIARDEPQVAIVADKGHSAPGPCAPEGFVAPPRKAERIAKNRSLKGEKIASLRAGFSEYLIDRLLEGQQLGREDIEHVLLPAGGGFINSKRSELDAIRYLSEPNLTNALAQGLRFVASGEEVAPGHQLGVILFGPRLLRDDPSLGLRFMRAYAKGVRQYGRGKERRNIEIISRATKLPPDLVERTCWQPVSPDGKVDPAPMVDYLDWAISRGYIEANLAVSDWWDPRFVEPAFRPAAGQ